MVPLCRGCSEPKEAGSCSPLAEQSSEQAKPATDDRSGCSESAACECATSDTTEQRSAALLLRTTLTEGSDSLSEESEALLLPEEILLRLLVPNVSECSTLNELLTGKSLPESDSLTESAKSTEAELSLKLSLLGELLRCVLESTGADLRQSLRLASTDICLTERFEDCAPRAAERTSLSSLLRSRRRGQLTLAIEVGLDPGDYLLLERIEELLDPAQAGRRREAEVLCRTASRSEELLKLLLAQTLKLLLSRKLRGVSSTKEWLGLTSRDTRRFRSSGPKLALYECLCCGINRHSLCLFASAAAFSHRLLS